MGVIYLVRHAATAWNREGRYQGLQDVPLDDRGRVQADRLGARLRGIRWDAVWCSHLARARETAERIASGCALVVEPGFRETAFGAWEGLTATEVRARYPREFARHAADPLAAPEPGGEAAAAVADRALEAFRRLWDPAFRRVLLVSHGAVLKVLILALLEADQRLRTRLVIDNASLSQLRLDRSGTRLLRLNDTGHLVGRGGGLATGARGTPRRPV